MHKKSFDFVNGVLTGSDEVDDNEIEYKISAVDVEHTSLNENNIFMIVNSVEELVHNDKKVKSS